MNIKRKSEYIGALGTSLVHVTITVLLILASFTVPRSDEKVGGIPAMTGDMGAAYGNYDSSTIVDVEVMPGEMPAPQPVPEVEAEQKTIIRTEGKTVAIKPKVEPKREKPEVEKKPEEATEGRTAEAKKPAGERTGCECKAAAEAASKRVADAFSEGSQTGGSKGSATSDEGIEGSKDGNLSTGTKSRVGECGTFNLGERSIREGGLPHPVYSIQEEGRVVVSTTVSPAGHVIVTNINRLTNMVDPTLCKAAKDTAKRARFNTVSGVNNQTGTTTYYFNLK